MTPTTRLVAVADAADDASSELTNLRAAYQAACAELIEVRRQRDEAVADGQALLGQLAEAEEKLSSGGGAGAAAADEATGVLAVAPPLRVAPAPDADRVVEEPAEPVVAVEPVAGDADEPAAPGPAPTAWLPPEDESTATSTAHEFAALKELSPDAVDDAPVVPEPLTSPMNVLPAIVDAARPSLWRRRAR